MTFEDAFALMAGDLAAYKQTQRVLGLTSDEVWIEMLEVLWRAVKTYDETVGTSIQQYWWVLWVRHKINLTQKFFRLKRRNEQLTDQKVMEEAMEALHPLVSTDDVPECPSEDVEDQTLWYLLSVGYNGKEVRSMMQMSWRQYYKRIERLRGVAAGVLAG